MSRVHKAQAPHRGTGLALCVRPNVRTSASAALTQTLPNFCQLRGLQRLGPERISSAALARPPEVTRTLCPGTAPELVAPGSATTGALAGAVAGATRWGFYGAPSSAHCSATPCAQRPRHAPCAISAAPSERRRPGQRVAPRGFCPLAEPAVPGASEGSEGSRALRARPRMHEHRAHAWGAAKHSTAKRENEHGAHAPRATHNKHFVLETHA
jgi:hypothetical protein